MGKPARSLTQDIKTLLAAHGWFVWKGGTVGAKNSQGQFYQAGTKGSPDLFALRNGQLVGLEIKAGKDVLRIDQVQFGEMLVRHGGRYFEVRSVDDLLPLIERKTFA